MTHNAASRPLSYADRVEIREWYRAREACILSAVGWGFDKYKYPYLDAMSPIERIVWDECIAAGIVMYPEYPVGPFWVDLGNPRIRVAIECDGKEYHADKAKDAARQRKLETEYGWEVYRIAGSEIYRGRSCPCEATDDEYEQWIEEPGLEQFIEKIWRIDRAEYRSREIVEPTVTTFADTVEEVLKGIHYRIRNPSQ